LTLSEENLTERQADVLRLTQEGKNPTDVGRELGISSQGVHGHLRRLRAKGLLPDEEPRPRARRRNGRTPAPVDYLSAIRAAAERAEREILDRQAEIDAEIADLKREREALDGALEEVRQKLA
jgi:predicted ArsR family transcriptional regulator